MELLVFGAAGIILGLIIVVIRTSVANARARRLLREAEAAEGRGDLPAAAASYKQLILATAANEQEAPGYIGRLEAVYRKLGRELTLAPLLEIHRTIVDVWKSKVPDREKTKLHRTAMEGMRARIQALP